MIIKRLELQGFKTFPERTKVVFNEGITIIIGPNGTGKSNIVEAIQWVLGGHRVKTVRGEKIEDVIFNGTLKRPAMGMADVTLVLQGEQEEMQINHRVFRSGESEYRLDGKTVRLRDIQDELWKKAISENKYFVIEQGAIGTFVTSKPAEKRALIEEAAGTAYYKDKKRLAENKLADTEQNLVRLEDIIAEVAKARNSLARQAGAAERYRILREEIRALTAAHFRSRSEQLLSGLREVQLRHEESLASEKEAFTRLASTERDVNAARRTAWDLEQSLKDGRESLYSLRSQSARTEAEREKETRRVELFEEKRAKAAAGTDELLEELLQLERDLVRAGEDRDSHRASHARAMAEAEALERSHAEAEASVAPWLKKVEILRAEHVEKFAALTEARNEGARIDKEIELVRRQEEKARRRRTEIESRMEEKRTQSAGIGSREAELRSRISGQETWIGRLEIALAADAAAIEADQAVLRKLREKRDEDAYHLQALRKLEEKERASEPLFDVEGALGPFTDLVESDPSDAPLVDVFWKEETRATIIEAEALLRNLGAREVRGRFLLLPAERRERPAVPDPSILGRPEVAGLLRGRLRPQPRLSGRLPSLGEAIIVRDIGAAVRLWLEHPSLSFVSTSGDVLYSSGLLKLGRREEGLFTLTQEIKELERKLAGREEEIRPVAARLDERQKQRLELERAVGTARVALSGQRTSLVEAEKTLALAKADLDNLADDLALTGHEIEVLSMDRTGFDRRNEAHALALKTLEGEERVFRERIEAEERELELHQERSIRTAKTLLEMRGALGLLVEKAANAETSIAALGRRKEAAAAKISALQDEARLAEEDKAAARELIAELEGKAEALAVQIRDQDAALAEGETRLAEIRTGLAAAEAGLTGLRTAHESAKDGRMSWEVRRAEIDRDLVNLEEACWQELKKTVQEVKAEPDAAEAGEGDLEARLEEAKDKLLRYGAVNLMAEEEYREQKTRHDFLVQQRKDLTDSIAQTKEAIVMIDEESRTRFQIALAEINTYFQELFQALFKGGTSEVKLTDEANPLESGVEVIAQPPGKKVQNMGLLSGGEKSLTSLAFLFALFKYKPTPFCILDEVDAALDEANLVRFLDLMRAIKSDTQFIIITHNYRTMEVADYIYGTTMEEPNVTKVFSMKLEKKPEETPVA
jgi:chromosome segregation protein